MGGVCAAFWWSMDAWARRVGAITSVTLKPYADRQAGRQAGDSKTKASTERLEAKSVVAGALTQRASTHGVIAS